MKANTPEVVVVTGASAGVGRAVVQAFARRGAHIGLLARGHEGLEGARRDVEAAGGKAIVIPTDTADPDQVEAAAAKVEETFGPIDVWVNDAMASVFSPFKEMKPEEFKRVTEVAYLGFVYGTMSALHRMLPRDKGHIIQVGSALAYRSIPLQSAYCGAKHGIMGFTDSIRCELIHDKSNVKITMVQLPAVNTPQFSWVKSRLPDKPQPVPPIYQPEVIGNAVAWVTDHYRRELFIGLSTVIAIQGNKVAPAYADHYLGRTGYKSQQTGEHVDSDRSNNLWQPVDEDQDHGAHRAFDSKAKSTSWQLWADTHIGLLALAGAGVASLIGAALFWRKQ
ncbi:MAG: SDR family oxidoreductase [Ktedonobacteraceae bacterium]|nr:SDR family oxidoreductase [Ktedonobacteraceae bacterium]